VVKIPLKKFLDPDRVQISTKIQRFAASETSQHARKFQKNPTISGVISVLVQLFLSHKVKIPFKNSWIRIMIRIITKILLFVASPAPLSSEIFHHKSSTTF